MPSCLSGCEKHGEKNDKDLKGYVIRDKDKISSRGQSVWRELTHLHLRMINRCSVKVTFKLQRYLLSLK